MIRRFARWHVILALGLLVLGNLLVACGDTATPTTAPPAATPTPAAGSGATTPAGGAEIAITLNEWSITPKVIPAAAGHQKFKVTNEGKFKHNFAILVNDKVLKTENLGKGESATLEADLAAGTYQTLCDIPGHKENGMAGSLEVK